MPRVPSPDSRPSDVYKDIIDLLVSETSESVSANLVLKGTYSKSSAAEPANEFVQSLSSEQRALLSDILRRERRSAIHDLLAVLSWYIDCHDVALTFRGEQMPVDLWDMGLHGDYISRLEGDGWPEPGGSAEA